MTARFTLAAMVALVLAFAPAVRAQTSQEDVKATFVYRFSSYVAWPPDNASDPVAPLVLCVVGANPFAHTLERVVSGRRAGIHPFEVRQIDGAADIDGCHAIYAVGERTEAVLRAARARPILTITDGGAERGMIHFVLVDDRIRFHIDDAAAAEGGLSIDPRLLSLALSVRRRPVS